MAQPANNDGSSGGLSPENQEMVDSFEKLAEQNRLVTIASNEFRGQSDAAKANRGS